MLRDLVFSFDCDEGQTASTFEHTKQLLASMLGVHVAQLFSKYVSAVMDSFYLKIGTAEECWKELCEEAKRPDPNDGKV